MSNVQPTVERDTHCTVYSRLWTEMITVQLKWGKRYSLYSLQPIVERDDHCTANCGKRGSLYSQLWKEIRTVQCTAYCGQSWSMYSLLWTEILTVQCTAYCWQRWSLYSQLWKEMITILTKARHEPHTQPTQCQRNCSPVATHSASSPRTDYPPQPQFLHQSSALMASPPDLTDPGDESLSVPASHNPRVLHRSRSDTRLVLGRHSSLDRTASPPWNPHPSLCEQSGHPGEFRWCTCQTLNIKKNHSMLLDLVFITIAQDGIKGFVSLYLLLYSLLSQLLEYMCAHSHNHNIYILLYVVIHGGTRSLKRATWNSVFSEIVPRHEASHSTCKMTFFSKIMLISKAWNKHRVGCRIVIHSKANTSMQDEKCSFNCAFLIWSDAAPLPTPPPPESRVFQAKRSSCCIAIWLSAKRCANGGSDFWLSIKSVWNTLSCCFVCAFDS